MLALVALAGTPLDLDSIVPLSEPVEVWYFDLGTPPTKSDTKTLDLEFTRQVGYCATQSGMPLV